MQSSSDIRELLFDWQEAILNLLLLFSIEVVSDQDEVMVLVKMDGAALADKLVARLAVPFQRTLVVCVRAMITTQLCK